MNQSHLMAAATLVATLALSPAVQAQSATPQQAPPAAAPGHASSAPVLVESMAANVPAWLWGTGGAAVAALLLIAALRGRRARNWDPMVKKGRDHYGPGSSGRPEASA